VDRCHFRHGAYQDEADAAWNGLIYNTKNLGETKAGLRIRFSNLVLERHLGKDQQSAMTIKSNGGGGLGGGSIHPCRDISIENVKMLNVIAGLQFRGIGTTVNNPLERVLVRNVGMLQHRQAAGNYTVSERALQIQSTVRYLTVENMTALLTPTLAAETSILSTDPRTPDTANVRIQDSILGGYYGIGYAGDPWGGLPPEMSGERTLRRLGLVDPNSATNYGSASNIRVAAPASAQFVSYANSTSDNMRLQAGSPFKAIGVGGADPGCDWDELDAATVGCISGVWA
jgi:hypothetical protein